MRFGSRNQLNPKKANGIGGVVGETDCGSGRCHHAAECGERLRQISRGPNLICLAGYAGPVQQISRRHAGNGNPRRIHQRDTGAGAGGAFAACTADGGDGCEQSCAENICHRQICLLYTSPSPRD